MRLGSPSFLLAFQEAIASLSLRTGDWAGGLAIATEALDGATPADAFHLRAVQAQFAILRGAPGAPLLAEIERDLGPATDPQTVSHLPIAQAITALASGEVRLARAATDRLELIFPPWADLIGEMVLARACLWAGDQAGAEQALGRLQQVASHGPGVDTVRQAVAAGVAVLAGRPDEARTGYRSSLRLAREFGLGFDEVLTVIDMATLLGPDDPDVQALADGARETLVRLEAQPLLARLDAALARSGASPAGRGLDRTTLTESAATTQA